MGTFSALLAFCARNSPVTGEFPAQRPMTRSFDVSLDLRLNQQMSKQWIRWWLETPLRSLWHHCNDCPIWIPSIQQQLLCIVPFNALAAIVAWSATIIIFTAWFKQHMSFFRENFDDMHCVNVRQWHKIQIHRYVSQSTSFSKLKFKKSLYYNRHLLCIYWMLWNKTLMNEY